MDLAPIALFVYNRPEHTRLTVEALKNNELSKESDLFIFADAAKSADQVETVEAVRRVVRLIDGFKSVTLIEQNSNLGLAQSIIEGVTMLCGKFGQVIVLEDDVVASPYFLQYMNDALDLYRNHDSVMHVSGATYPIGRIEPDTFFFRVPLCWGWATWARAWRHFTKNDDIMLRFDEPLLKKFTFNGSYDTWEQLELNRDGLISTWFVYWYAALFFRGGLALFSSESLVRNIGMDGSGVHCKTTSYYDMTPTNKAVKLKPSLIHEAADLVHRHEQYFRRRRRRPIHLKLYRVVRRAILWATKKAFRADVGHGS